MLVDSHCHLTFPELHDRLDQVMASMEANRVGIALCVAVDLEDFRRVRAVPEFPKSMHRSVCTRIMRQNRCLDRFFALPLIPGWYIGNRPDYRLTGDLEWQRERFRIHIGRPVAASPSSSIPVPPARHPAPHARRGGGQRAASCIVY